MEMRGGEKGAENRSLKLEAIDGGVLYRCICSVWFVKPSTQY